MLVLPALPRPDQRGPRSSIPRSSARGRRARVPTARPRPGSSTCTSAASSTRCCTSCTRASGTRCCSTSATCRRSEPFQRLVNQGMILAAAYTDERGHVRRGVGGRGARRRVLPRRPAGHARVREDGQEPEERGHARRHLPRLRRRHACGSTRWRRARSTRRGRGTPPTSSACTASCSGCGATSSTRTPATLGVADATPDDETRRVLHRTIAAVRDDMAAMSFNTAIARLTECNNHLTQVVARDGAAPRAVAAAAGADGRAAGAAHRRGAWARLGHADTLTYEPFPVAGSGAGSSTTRSRCRCRSTARCGPDHRAGRRRRGRPRAAARADDTDRRAARRRRGPQGDRRPRPHRQLRRRRDAS